MANTVFNNKIIEAKAKDLLTTSVNARSLMTIDNSLTQEAGMTKTINVYTYTGTAEEVGVGEGNSTRGSISYTSKDYTVKYVQQTFDYQDEDFMKDGNIVDNLVKGATDTMTNKMTADFVAEAKKATLSHSAEAFGYDAIVDAISKANLEKEADLFVLIPNSWKADLRKDDDYKAARMGEVIYSGQVGTICGLPVVATKALTDEAFVMTKEAVKLFVKKDVAVEQDRDIETRTNTVVLGAAYLVALENADKIVKITRA